MTTGSSKTDGKQTDEEKHQALYLEQRDKHLSQLMAINGRAAFGVLTVFASVLVGLKDIKDLHLSFCATAAICALALAAVATLGYGAFLMSAFILVTSESLRTG